MYSKKHWSTFIKKKNSINKYIRNVCISTNKNAYN